MDLKTDSFEFGQKFDPFDELEGEAVFADPIYYIDTQSVTIDDEDLVLAYFLVPDTFGYAMIAILLGNPEVSGFDLFNSDETESAVQESLEDLLGDLVNSIALSEDGMQGSNYAHFDVYEDLALWFADQFPDMPELELD